MIFMSEIAPIRQTLVVCVSDANLRRMQLPKRDRAIADAYIKGIFFSGHGMRTSPFFSLKLIISSKMSNTNSRGDRLPADDLQKKQSITFFAESMERNQVGPFVPP